MKRGSSLKGLQKREQPIREVAISLKPIRQKRAQRENGKPISNIGNIVLDAVEKRLFALMEQAKTIQTIRDFDTAKVYRQALEETYAKVVKVKDKPIELKPLMAQFEEFSEMLQGIQEYLQAKEDNVELEREILQTLQQILLLLRRQSETVELEREVLQKLDVELGV